MIKEISQQAETRMKKSVEALQTELAKLRTGRAHTSLLEHIKVEYYGSLMPLNQVANVAVLDARTLSVQPWEKNMVTVVEKAILESDLGLNPATSGMLIRIPLPALTEERRRELTKVLRNEGEKAKVAIRNIRRDSNNELKELLKEKAVTEDDERKSQEAIQKLTDKFIAEVETVLAQKEADLMTL
ncbi:MAG: ribosome recycling factor [Gammaproteobacteria bacterium RIFCSPHIGHO2_12_FULL_35_23]|nr:MAG: ribosome recycling factor [Gammaproteobacteria bacterium RIFCSPHIGHO2_12_FULL_35_23]